MSSIPLAENPGCLPHPEESFGGGGGGVLLAPRPQGAQSFPSKPVQPPVLQTLIIDDTDRIQTRVLPPTGGLHGPLMVPFNDLTLKLIPR